MPGTRAEVGVKGEKRRKPAPVSVIAPEGGWAVQAHVPWLWRMASVLWPRSRRVCLARRRRWQHFRGGSGEWQGCRKDVTDQTDKLAAQSPVEGVRKSVQIVKCVFACSLECTPVTFHRVLVNSCRPTMPPRTHWQGLDFFRVCVLNYVFHIASGETHRRFSVSYITCKSCWISTCALQMRFEASILWITMTPIKVRVRKTCCSWQKNLIAEARTEMLLATFLLACAQYLLCLKQKQN